jgi:hypothetical protein
MSIAPLLFSIGGGVHWEFCPHSQGTLIRTPRRLFEAVVYTDLE